MPERVPCWGLLCAACQTSLLCGEHAEWTCGFDMQLMTLELPSISLLKDNGTELSIHMKLLWEPRHMSMYCITIMHKWTSKCCYGQCFKHRVLGRRNSLKYHRPPVVQKAPQMAHWVWWNAGVSSCGCSCTNVCQFVQWHLSLMAQSH